MHPRLRSLTISYPWSHLYNRTDHACSGSYRSLVVLSHGLTPAACIQRRHAQRLEVGSCLKFAYCNASLLPSSTNAWSGCIANTRYVQTNGLRSLFKADCHLRREGLPPKQWPLRAWPSCFHASHGPPRLPPGAEFMVFFSMTIFKTSNSQRFRELVH